MTLTFKGKRISIIRRLRGLTNTEIENRCMKILSKRNKLNIDRWEEGHQPRDTKSVEALAKATGVPIGFYYYRNVQIDMKDLVVEIYIPETNERVKFNFA